MKQPPPMSVTVFGSAIEVRAAQSWKALSYSSSTPAGRVISVSAVQPRKAWRPIKQQVEGSVTDFRAVQASKALVSRHITPALIFTVCSVASPAKAFSSIAHTR